MASPEKKLKAANDPQENQSAEKIASDQTSHELVFGIVGHVGSGTSTVAEALKGILEALSSHGAKYQCEIVKARSVIETWAGDNGRSVPPKSDRPTMEEVVKFQDLGDDMRLTTKDHAAVARGAILKIREQRAALQGSDLDTNKPVIPDGKPRAFIIDSIRHPAEVQLLRHLYADGFVLVGVVCEEVKRKERLSKKYRDAGLDAAETFMQRDAKAKEEHGQKVSDAFHLSDYFLDNTAPRHIGDDVAKANPEWQIADDLNRLIRLVTHDHVERPTVHETAMFEAAGAAMRSSCLSRQVGSALLDQRGNIVATGANEVPKAGGGVYGEQFEPPIGSEVKPLSDDRCFNERQYCSNTREQNVIAEAVISDIQDSLVDETDRNALITKIKKGRVGELIEFSRAVHAEMDALLAAGRKGSSTVGCRLYVTTFPCHYCARHIVSAGVDEVQYIEPYPKSKAISLHDDSIQNNLPEVEWQPPSSGGAHVLFRPFTGVAPRMYRRAFRKDRELKNKETGDMLISKPVWGSPYDISKISYAEFELVLTRELIT